MLTMTKDGDTGLTARRDFDTTPDALWQAHVDAKLIRQWMLGPEGWTMTRCESGGAAGEAIHFAWQDDTGASFYLTGEILEAEAPNRMVHIERMHLPDPTPDNRVETRITSTPRGCSLMLHMHLPDAQTRDAMLDSGIADGMEASYARLAALLAS